MSRQCCGEHLHKKSSGAHTLAHNTPETRWQGRGVGEWCLDAGWGRQQAMFLSVAQGAALQKDVHMVPRSTSKRIRFAAQLTVVAA